MAARFSPRGPLVVDGPVSEERDAHAVVPEEAVAVSGSGRHDDAGPDDPARTEEADRGRTDACCHPPARAPGDTPEELGHEGAGATPLARAAVPPRTVRAQHRVVRPEMGGHAHRDRFLADVGVTGAVNQPRGVRPGECFLRPPDHDHLPVQRQGTLAPAPESSRSRSPSRSLQRRPSGGQVGQSLLPPAFMARLPPSTGKLWPVMKPAASEARKTAAFAISSGSPIRSRGMPLEALLQRRRVEPGIESMRSIAFVMVWAGWIAFTRIR